MPLSLISLSPVFCVGGKSERKILGIGSRYFYCGSIYSKILLFGHDVCLPDPGKGMRFSVPLGTFFDPQRSPGDTLDTCSVISSTSSTRSYIQFFFRKIFKNSLFISISHLRLKISSESLKVFKVKCERSLGFRIRLFSYMLIFGSKEVILCNIFAK